MARYIDAEALAEKMRLQYCKDCNNYNEVRCRACDIDDTIDFIEDAPTAEVVEVKHGEWVKNGKTRTCSCCGYFYINVDMEDDNYCPNCGAKMDGERKEKMTIKDLIGFQLISINSEEIVVRKDDKEYTLYIIDDEGDCCGFNDITTELLINKTDLQNNPIITNVEIEESEDEYGDGAKGKLTFFGAYKPIATVDTYSSSGSGWTYGACVTVECEMLGIKDTVSSW